MSPAPARALRDSRRRATQTPCGPENILYCFLPNLTGFVSSIQVFFRTPKIHLDCSMSCPDRGFLLRNGTNLILNPFLQFLNYQRFEGVEPPEGCKNVAWMYTTFLPRLKFVCLVPKLSR